MAKATRNALLAEAAHARTVEMKGVDCDREAACGDGGEATQYNPATMHPVEDRWLS